ncbi:MAG: ABC-2 family transporter protein [Ardenticatenaceae bacterium]|nr:ABC-2 family transporter protein [Ardenticatenaceae bacterium]MCB8992069.1 ABC-2 family transporter protein [Ardenticatenaceae bacterium]MCB9005686.1 ABC-2 family transporter protein [Ardenticatenaceae bacterium]
MTRYLNLYGYFLKQRFKILLEYRVNFFIGASSSVFMQGASLLAIWVVMRQVPSLNGWTLAEIWFIYGLLTLSKSINHMFADNLWTLGQSYVRTGLFDRFLVRPIDPLFHLLADRFCHDGIGNFLVGLVLVVGAAPELGIVWTPLKVGYLTIAVLSGGAIFIALNLMTSVSAFWVMDSVPVIRVVFEMHEFAKYPLAIYPKAIGIILTWLIPYGFASFYPASYLLQRDISPVLAWAGPLVAVVLLFVGYRVWLFGLRHYSSTGS